MRLRIHHHGEAGADFRRQVSEAVLHLPVPLQAQLASSGVSVHAARTIIDLLPELAHEHPRGWDADATWRSVSGLYDPATGRVVVAELFDFLGDPQQTSNPGGILRHEVGHALDQVLGGVAHTRSFAEMHARGASRAEAEGLRSLLQYYLQPGSTPDAGAEETFAELAGMVLGGGAAPDLQYVLAGTFVEAYAHVAELIHTLRAP